MLNSFIMDACFIKWIGISLLPTFQWNYFSSGGALIKVVNVFPIPQAWHQAQTLSLYVSTENQKPSELLILWMNSFFSFIMDQYPL